MKVNSAVHGEQWESLSPHLDRKRHIYTHPSGIDPNKSRLRLLNLKVLDFNDFNLDQDINSTLSESSPCFTRDLQLEEVKKNKNSSAGNIFQCCFTHDSKFNCVNYFCYL